MQTINTEKRCTEKESCERKREIYIWGIGAEAEKCISNLDLKRCQIMGYIETKPCRIAWKGKRVYAPDHLSSTAYDYLIIANTFFDEIIRDIRKNELADEKKVVDWVKFKECIYHYPKEIWELFSEDFFAKNCYVFNTNKESVYINLADRLDRYEKIFIYDFRFTDCKFDIGLFLEELLYTLKVSKAGMAFIPDKGSLEQVWYHNLLSILDKNAFVIWENEESAYVEYIKSNTERFSFAKFGMFQFTKRQTKFVSKGRFMILDERSAYEQKCKSMDNNVKYIKICILRSDRIGEEIRVLNKLLLEEEREDCFNLFIPVDGYGRPSVGVNACFNELIGRRLALLKKQEEYYLWVQDIFDKYEIYEYDRKGIDVSELGCKVIDDRIFVDFNEDERNFGKKILKDKLGIIDNEYVCLHTRDSSYLSVALPDIDYSYHDYRDVNFKVMNNVIDYFEGCGIRSVRVGQITEGGAESDKYIDLVRLGYDEYLDLMLHRFCKFFMGTSAGVFLISKFFARPCALLLPYYPLIEHNLFFNNRDMCIFNRFYNVNEKKEMSFAESFNFSIDFMLIGRLRGEYFAQNGIMMIPFTEEDSWELAKEMNEKIDGRWIAQDGDGELHDRFNLLLKQCIEKKGVCPSELMPINVATTYLRRYRHLLNS